MHYVRNVVAVCSVAFSASPLSTAASVSHSPPLTREDAGGSVGVFMHDDIYASDNSDLGT